MLRCRELKLALPDGLLRIQALDRVMGGLLKKDAQASFRISTFRLQHKIDLKPDEQTLEHFFDLLLAEAARVHDDGTKERGSGREHCWESQCEGPVSGWRRIPTATG